MLPFKMHKYFIFCQNPLNPWKYLKNQGFRRGHTVSSGIRNNSASLCTGYWREPATKEEACFQDHCPYSSSWEYQ